MRKDTIRIEHLRRSPIRAAMAFALLIYAPLWAAYAQSAPAPDARIHFDIPAGDLAAALDGLSTQADLSLAYQPELVTGKRSLGLLAQMTWQEALTRLLQGSGLEWRQVNATTVVIRRPEGKAKPAARPSGAASSASTAGEKLPVTDIQGFTVTGTRIRGGTTPSPVITIGAEDIQQEGFTDLGEVIRSVPQNFTGGQNPGVIPFNISGAGVQNQNITGGSSLNLRGLGPDATLMLLNGRRMAYGGYTQAVDISAIPVAAVERFEIVPDGASAIYGSDAVGGVGNVILKRDFEGVTVGALYGGATDGGLGTREYTVTTGTNWSTGGLLATYKDASADPIYARQRTYTDYLVDGYTLYPGSDLHSGLVSAYQSLGEVAQLRLDAFRTRRSQNYAVEDYTANALVRASPHTTTSLAAPSIDFFLPNDWMLSIDGVWSKSDHVQFQEYENLDTKNTFFTIKNCYCNQLRMYEVGAEGPLFSLSGGDARLALGAGYRKNTFSQDNLITGGTDIQGADQSRFAYGEISLPLVGPESGVAGARRLELTAAARTENYDNFGKVTTPKLGIVYGPSADFTLKASWGKSFKAPTLNQRFYMFYSLVQSASQWGGSGANGATVLSVGGGNRHLGPERARSWTGSLAFHPETVPGLQAELTWFDIDYTDRVVQPIPNSFQALVNPVYDRFIVRSPTPEQQAEAIASTDLFYDFTGTIYDPAKVVALVYAQYFNVARQKIKGLDLSSSYQFNFGDGQMTLRGSATWLDSTQQTIPGQPTFDLAGTLYNPPRISARGGIVWSRGAMTASFFANYKSGVRDMVQGNKTASFTTFDGTWRYATDQRDGWWSGVEFALSAQNLFDRAPPPHQISSGFQIPPYDATNYSAVGRYVSVSAAKHW